MVEISNHAEDVLFLSLTDTDALETLVTIGLEPLAIPTESMRPVVAWAIDRFFESGRTRAPTRAAMLETWGERIDDARVELLPEDEDTDTIQWAVEWLKSQYVHYRFQQFLRSAGTDMATADVDDRVKMLGQKADDLLTLSMSVQPRHTQAEATQGVGMALAQYEAREREGHITRGMVFGTGMEAIDLHTYGIHPGEVAVLAAGPKTGKSFMLARVAKECWNSGRESVLFTLENTVEMTYDRIVCMQLGISYRRFQRGQCTPGEVEEIRAFVNDELPQMNGLLHVVMPEPGKRTMASMVRQAQMMGATGGLFIDQLTFVEHPDPGRKARPEIIRDLMHDLKTLVSSGPQPLPTMIAHQVNREGMASARKSGHLLMEHMAEGSEVERTADWVFGLYQSKDQRLAGEALFQVLASRREDIKAWDLSWSPAGGLVGVNQEREIRS